MHRFIIGCTALTPFPASHIAEQYQISRTYVYTLRNQVSRFFLHMQNHSVENWNRFCETFVPGTQLFVVDESFYEKMVLSLALDGFASEEGIQRFLETNFQKHISIGKISGILNRAADRAAEFDASIDLSGIRQGANDEIFQCGMPVLTGIDPVSTYIYLLQQADDRSAETWQNAMEVCKARKLDLDVSISDFGTGLLSGIPRAFPNVCIQPDLFHWILELGKEISSQERKAYALLSDYYQYEAALSGQRVHEKTFQKLLLLEEKLYPTLEQCDTLQILYQWLKEMTDYHGWSYGETLSLCNWIFDRMEEVTQELSGSLKRAISKTRRNLPEVLVYLNRVEETLKSYALEHGYPKETFVLLYKMLGYQPDSLEYRAAERRVRRKLKGAYGSCYLKVQEILDGVKRASSLVENLNGRLRPYMNLKRMVPKKFLTLLKVYFNTKKYRRSRKAERVGKSPLELLTGQKQKDFYDIVCGG